MKIQKKFTNAARGMMAMKKDVAKDVMANLAENGTMFDKDKVKGKTGKIKRPKAPTVDPNNPDDPNILNYPDGKFYEDEKGFIKPINRHPDYKRKPEMPPSPPKKKPSLRDRRKGEKGMKYNEAKGGMQVQYKMMQEGGKNRIGEDIVQMKDPSDARKGEFKTKMPLTNELVYKGEPISQDVLKSLYSRNKLNKDDLSSLQSQLSNYYGINDNIENLITSGRLESKISDAKSKSIKSKMMRNLNQPAKQDKTKTGEKGMTYKKGPGGMVISFVRKNKSFSDGGKLDGRKAIYGSRKSR